MVSVSQTAPKKRWIYLSSIKTQFALFMVALFLVLVIFCGVLIHSVSQAMLTESLQYAEGNCEDFQTAISEITRWVDSVSNQLQYEPSCLELLSATSYRNVSLETIRSINTAIASASAISSALTDVAFTNELFNWSKLYRPDELREIHAAMPDERGLICLGIWHSSSPKDATDYLVYGYHVYSGTKQLGTMLLSVDVHSTAARLPSPQTAGSYLVLIDSKGDDCSFGASGALPEDVLVDFRELAAQSGKSSAGSAGTNSPQLVHRGDYSIHVASLPEVRGILISAVNAEEAQLELDSFYLLSGIFLSVFIIMLLCGGFLLYQGVVSPLNKFSSTIDFIREKRLRKLDQPLMLNGCAELKQIGRDFSDLLVSINTLTGEILQKSNALYEAEVLRKSAELDFLRSQINPHFLYNTLELIRAAALHGNIEQVSLITSAMGKIYRYTAKGAPLVPLSQEIAIVKSYVSIQQARFQNRITTLYNVSKEAAEVPVFKMLVQPLVENAFVHGLEPKPDAGVLYIGAKTEGSLLVISVRDDGVGIPPETLAELERQLASSRYDMSTHLGLANINARLKLQYGEEYGLSLSSSPGDGTCVTIRLPIQGTLRAPQAEQKPERTQEDTYGDSEGDA